MQSGCCGHKRAFLHCVPLVAAVPAGAWILGWGKNSRLRVRDATETLPEKGQQTVTLPLRFSASFTSIDGNNRPAPGQGAAVHLDSETESIGTHNISHRDQQRRNSFAHCAGQFDFQVHSRTRPDLMLAGNQHACAADVHNPPHAGEKESSPQSLVTHSQVDRKPNFRTPLDRNRTLGEFGCCLSDWK